MVVLIELLTIPGFRFTLALLNRAWNIHSLGSHRSLFARRRSDFGRISPLFLYSCGERSLVHSPAWVERASALNRKQVVATKAVLVSWPKLVIFAIKVDSCRYAALHYIVLATVLGTKVGRRVLAHPVEHRCRPFYVQDRVVCTSRHVLRELG